MASKNDAQAAIFDAVVEVCKEAEDYSGTSKSQMVRDAATAYRLAAGGQQPGSIIVKSD